MQPFRQRGKYPHQAEMCIRDSPEVWKKTIFILAYDENDGYFDHVPPFTAPNTHKPETGAVSKGIDTRVDFVTLEQELAVSYTHLDVYKRQFRCFGS